MGDIARDNLKEMTMNEVDFLGQEWSKEKDYYKYDENIITLNDDNWLVIITSIEPTNHVIAGFVFQECILHL